MYDTHHTTILLRWLSLLVDKRGMVISWIEKPYFETNMYHALALWKEHHEKPCAFDHIKNLAHKQIHDIASCLALRHPLKEIHRYSVSLDEYLDYPEALGIYIDKSYLGAIHFFDVFGDQLWNISKPFDGEAKSINAFIRVYQIYHIASHVVHKLSQWDDQKSEVVRLQTLVKYPLQEWMNWIEKEHQLSRVDKHILSWKDLFVISSSSEVQEDYLMI